MATNSSLKQEKQMFYVQSHLDNKKFKMVIKGDLNTLQVEKVKRYLKSYGCDLTSDDSLVLMHNDIVLEDKMIGEEFGLVPNTVLQVRPNPRRNNTAPLAQRSKNTVETIPSPAAEHVNVSANAYQPIKKEESTSVKDPDTTSLLLENAQLRCELEKLRLKVENCTIKGEVSCSASADAFGVAREMLKNLSEDIDGGLLAFDDNGSCVIGNEAENAVVLTFDQATERIYLYSTVLTSLPPTEIDGDRLRAAEIKNRLFETLLSFTQLGRDTNGASLILSIENGMLLMSTSVSARPGRADVLALRDTFPGFLEALARYRSIATGVLRDVSEK